jgi:hypothetical protein
MFVLLMEEIYGVRVRHEVASGGMMYIPSFMKTGTGVQAILRFCLRNLRGYNVGIADGRDL